MVENPNQQKKLDAVLGDQAPPADAAVLGGWKGVVRVAPLSTSACVSYILNRLGLSSPRLTNSSSIAFVSFTYTRPSPIFLLAANSKLI